MEETVFYIAEGSPSDKQSQESFALATSIHTSQQHASFRQADCPKHGGFLTGNGQGEKLFVVNRAKALLQVYSWGKESADQKIALPEALTCIDVCYQPEIGDDDCHKLPNFRVPWLIAGGSASGRIYIWELASGNLLCVKDCHYQKISTVKFSKCGTFLISGSDDSRVLVWKTIDLISIYEKENDQLKSVKPFYSINDNTLPITDFVISTGLINDLKLYTTSHDCTVRIYNIMTKSLLSTFVLPTAIECITKDPANRNLYVGLTNGSIKTIPLYHINPNTNVLETIGGNQKIVTIPNDPNLNFTFVHHQQNVIEKSSLLHKSINKTGEDSLINVTTLDISMDGTSIISGDSLGRVYVADIVTKQVIKTFTPCNSPISYLKVQSIPKNVNVNGNLNKQDKRTRLIPNLKRVLASNDPVEHQLYIEISKKIDQDIDEDNDENFNQWINTKRQENLEFKNLSNINSTVKQVGGIEVKHEVNSNKSEELQSKLDKVSQAYTELRNKHEELLKTHTEFVNSK